MSTRKTLLCIGPLAILALLLFIAIGGEVVMQLELASAIAVRLAPDHLLADAGNPRTLPDSLRRIWAPRPGRSSFGHRMAERRARMSPEERKRFRKGLRGRCGPGPSTAESEEQ